MEPTSYILIHLVEKQPVGYIFRSTRTSWPLHITLVSWFYTSYSLTELEQRLQNYLKRTASFSVAVGPEKMFGHDNDIPVNVIADQTELRKLHRGLLQLVESCQASLVNRAWVQEKFCAHITHHLINKQQEGDQIKIDDISIVRLLNAEQRSCEIVAHIKMENHENAA